ncbi:MAG: hypothetical protein PHU85_02350 [Phycisphaerae bacterium]|nr:hypothetical protein [Phycisphaerae bacterium]
MEITGASLEKVHNDYGDHEGTHFPFRAEMEAMFLRVVEATPALREAIEDAMLEMAGERSGGDPRELN